jgi:hypothetical protein
MFRRRRRTSSARPQTPSRRPTASRPDDEGSVGYLFDVRPALSGSEEEREAFALAVWCATTGLSPEEGRRREAAARERVARYGPPLEPPADEDVWPETITCAHCGEQARPSHTFTELLDDVPQLRWVRRWLCLPCYEQHNRRKWQAIARGMHGGPAT